MSVMELAKDAQPQQFDAEGPAAAAGALWQGYDSVSGKARGTAVLGELEPPQSGHSRVTYKVCTDLLTLSNTLEISQSLSVTYGKIASGSEKTDFVSNLNVTTYSVSIVVHARHVSGIESMKTVGLKEGISAPKDAASRKTFFLLYGDSFISSRTLGGEYIAVYTFYSRSKEEQDSLTAEMKAQGMWNGVSVDASLQAKIQSFTSSTQTRSSFSQMVTGIMNPSLPAADGIIGYALDFPNKKLDAPSILGFLTTGYQHVFGDFGKIPDNCLYFIGTGVIDGLTKSLVDVRQLQDQIGWLSAIYRFYGYGGDPSLPAASAAAKRDLVAIDGQMQIWENDPEPSGGFPELKLETPGLGTPALNFTFHRSDAYGGGGGGPFNDVDTSTYLELQTRIVSVQLRTGSWVDCLITTYQDSTGKKWTPNDGGDGGSLSATLQFMAGEFVSGVYGRAGSLIDNFNIESTGGGSIGGGRYGGPAFEWSVPKDSVVLGFAGRADSSLHQVQVYYATFDRTKWSGDNSGTPK